MGSLHFFNIVKMGFGVVLLFVAIILWSMARRSSAVLLAVTSILFYAQIVVDLLDFYGIIAKESLLVVKDVPVLAFGVPIIVIASFILTLLLFIVEERK